MPSQYTQSRPQVGQRNIELHAVYSSSTSTFPANSSNLVSDMIFHSIEFGISPLIRMSVPHAQLNLAIMKAPLRYPRTPVPAILAAMFPKWDGIPVCSPLINNDTTAKDLTSL